MCSLTCRLLTTSSDVATISTVQVSIYHSRSTVRVTDSLVLMETRRKRQERLGESGPATAPTRPASPVRGKKRKGKKAESPPLPPSPTEPESEDEEPMMQALKVSTALFSTHQVVRHRWFLSFRWVPTRYPRSRIAALLPLRWGCW